MVTCKWHGCCPVNRFTREGLLERHWVEKYCLAEHGHERCVRYAKEAAGEPHPDNMLPDGTIDPRLA